MTKRRAAKNQTTPARAAAKASPLVGLLLLLSACGASGGDKAAPTTKPKDGPAVTTTVPSKPTTTQPKADDDGVLSKSEALDVVSAVQVTEDDLPDWDADASASDDSDSPIDDCIGENIDLESHQVAQGRSQSFQKDTDDGGELAIDSVSRYLDDEDASSEFVEQMKEDDQIACISDALKQSAEAQQVSVDGDFKKVELNEGFGDDAAAISGTFTVADVDGAGDEAMQINTMVVVVRTGNLLTGLTATATNTEGDPDILDQLVPALADRQAEALGVDSQGTDEPTDDPVDEPTTDTSQIEHRVNAATLTVEDLPDGWTAEPADDDDEDGAFYQCIDDFDLADSTVAKHQTDQFTLESGDSTLTFDLTSGYLDDQDKAESLLASAGSQAFSDCSSQLLATQDDNVDVEGSFSPSSGLPGLASDEAVALGGDFTLTNRTNGASADLSAVVVVIRTDQLVSTVTATAVNGSLDNELLQQVIETVAQRQQA